MANFTEKETKLLRLALDQSALEGEWKNSIMLFCKSLRDRSFTWEDLTGKPNPQPQYSKPKQTSWGTTKFPFGKYKGEMLEDIDIQYLHWAMGWINEDSGRSQRFGWLVMAIENYLKE